MNHKERFMSKPNHNYTTMIALGLVMVALALWLGAVL